VLEAPDSPVDGALVLLLEQYDLPHPQR
jgi:hypothetical protein